MTENNSSQTNYSYDVIVIGGGSAGLELQLRLTTMDQLFF